MVSRTEQWYLGFRVAYRIVLLKQSKVYLTILKARNYKKNCIHTRIEKSRILSASDYSDYYVKQLKSLDSIGFNYRLLQ